MTQDQHDTDLQRQIDTAAFRLMHSPDRLVRMRAMDELRKLKSRQRPERVEQIERERGLRK